MNSIYYNPKTKEVGIVIGYAFSQGINIQSLYKYLDEILSIFKTMKPEDISFHEVSNASRSHKYMYYCKFIYELPIPENESGYCKYYNHSIFVTEDIDHLIHF